ncbi:hypothetical protein BC829DRAFT_385265 [Chytridium lagenaria]|nr:hypothetical protein BC829DRAFT_385265 [Chytridium lagenaria]
MDNAHGTSLASTPAMTASDENPSPPLTIRDESVVCSGLSHKNYMPSVLPSMILESSVDNNESEGDGKDSLAAVNKQKNLCVSPISDHGREASSTGLTSLEAKSASNLGSRVAVDEEFAVDFELSSDDDVGVGRKDKRVDAAKTLSPVSFGREEVSLVSKNRREGRDTEVRVERMGELRVSRHGGDMAKRMLGSLGQLRDGILLTYGGYKRNDPFSRMIS